MSKQQFHPRNNSPEDDDIPDEDTSLLIVQGGTDNDNAADPPEKSTSSRKMHSSSIGLAIASSLVTLFVLSIVGDLQNNEKPTMVSVLRASISFASPNQVDYDYATTTTTGRKSVAPSPPVVSSRLDPDFAATVFECVDMLYTGGEDLTIDRPNHLRAASSMQWITDSRLAIVQDDSNFIALVDIDLNEANDWDDNDNDNQKTIPSLRIKDAYSISLPSSTTNGYRQFQKSRGNKNLKLDLEASVYIPKEYTPNNEGGFLLGFGSGSGTINRDVIILIRDSILLNANDHVNVNFQPVNITFWSNYCGNKPLVDVVTPSPIVAFYAPSLYESLRHQISFSGSELNIEGAAYVKPTNLEPGKIRFFQRGNGAPDVERGLNPKSSTGEVVADDLFRYMDSLLVADGQDPIFFQEKSKWVLPPPQVHDIVNFDLGSVNGVSLTFTGSAPAAAATSSAANNRVFEETDFIYTAGAEASPDATRDGAVVGTAIGLVKSIDYFASKDKLDYDAGIYNFMTYPNGTKFLHKTEGITIPPGTGFWRRQGDGIALTVLDLDNPNVPSQMCLVQVKNS